jgi:hypothetical protein
MQRSNSSDMSGSKGMLSSQSFDESRFTILRNSISERQARKGQLKDSAKPTLRASASNMELGPLGGLRGAFQRRSRGSDTVPQTTAVPHMLQAPRISDARLCATPTR